MGTTTGHSLDLPRIMSDNPFQRGCKSMDAARVEILVPIISKILDRINTTYHAQKWLGAHGDMRCKHCSDRGLDCVSQRSRVACRRCLHSKKSYSCSRLVLAIKETIPKYRSGYFSDVLITRALREAESRRRKVRSRSVDTGCISDVSSVAASTTIAEEDTEDDSYPIPSKFEVSFNLGIDSTIEDYANAYNVAQKSLRNEEWRSQDLLYVLREHEAELLAQTRKSRELEAVVLDMTDERKSLVEDNNNLYDECKRLHQEKIACLCRST